MYTGCSGEITFEGVAGRSELGRHRRRAFAAENHRCAAAHTPQQLRVGVSRRRHGVAERSTLEEGAREPDRHRVAAFVIMKRRPVDEIAHRLELTAAEQWRWRD